jgi:hypothetical protein
MSQEDDQIFADIAKAAKDTFGPQTKVELLAERNLEIERLRHRIFELEEFVSACRYAGPDGVEQLRKEAQELLSKKK